MNTCLGMEESDGKRKKIKKRKKLCNREACFSTGHTAEQQTGSVSFPLFALPPSGHER